MKTIKELEQEIIDNKCKRVGLELQKEPIERELNRLFKRNIELGDQIAKIKMNDKVTDWEWLLYTSNAEQSMEKYHLRERKLREINLMSGGFFFELSQIQVRIALVKNDEKSLPATLKGLNKILKYIKPFNGYKRIDIFEHSLSKNGCWNLLINEEKSEYIIQLTRYGNESIEHKFEDLKSALEKIQKTYYYEDAEEED